MADKKIHVTEENLDTRFTNYDADIKNYMVDNYTYITVDNNISAYSTNPVTSEAIQNALDALDTELTEEFTKVLGDISRLTYVRVDAVPATADAEAGTVYLVPDASGENVYYQYMLLNDEMFSLGSTSVNLSNYVTKQEIKNAVYWEDDETADEEYSADYLINKNLRLTYDAKYIYLTYGSTVLSRIPMPTGGSSSDSGVACTFITLDASTYEVRGLGKKTQAIATVLPTDTTDTITFVSSNEDIATVDSNGYIIAQSDGQCLITAICGSQSVNASVTIVDLTIVNSLTLSIPDNVHVYDSYNGHTADKTCDVSSDYTIDPTDYAGIVNLAAGAASFDQSFSKYNINNGVVTVTGPGCVTVTASAGDKTATDNVSFYRRWETGSHGVAADPDGISYPTSNTSNATRMLYNHPFLNEVSEGDTIIIETYDTAYTDDSTTSSGLKFGFLAYSMNTGTTTDDIENIYSFPSTCQFYRTVSKKWDLGWSIAPSASVTTSAGGTFENIADDDGNIIGKRLTVVANGTWTHWSLCLAYKTGSSSGTIDGVASGALNSDAVIENCANHMKVYINGEDRTWD